MEKIIGRDVAVMHENRGIGLAEIFKNPRILFHKKENIMEERGGDYDMVDSVLNEEIESENDKKKKGSLLVFWEELRMHVRMGRCAWNLFPVVMQKILF